MSTLRERHTAAAQRILMLMLQFSNMLAIENALIIIGESFWVFGASTQLRKLHKTRNIRGLSAATITLNAAGNIAWITYFSLNHLWFPVATNVLLFALTVGVLYYILTDKRTFAKGLVAITAISPVTAVVLLEFSTVAGWLGMIYNGLAATPWLLRVIRTRKVSGLSEHSLWLAVGATACACAYGVLTDSVPLVASCIQGFIINAIVLRYFYYYRHKKGH